jgi:hypothetical protein
MSEENYILRSFVIVILREILILLKIKAEKMGSKQHAMRDATYVRHFSWKF